MGRAAELTQALLTHLSIRIKGREPGVALALGQRRHKSECPRVCRGHAARALCLSGFCCFCPSLSLSASSSLECRQSPSQPARLGWASSCKHPVFTSLSPPPPSNLACYFLVGCSGSLSLTVGRVVQIIWFHCVSFGNKPQIPEDQRGSATDRSHTAGGQQSQSPAGWSQRQFLLLSSNFDNSKK